jgi:transposase
VTQGLRFVGLDVHVRQTTVAVLDKETGELSRFKLRMGPEEVVEHLAGMGGPLRAVYEAGPTGLGLARLAAGRGIDVRVCAPGLIPRAPSDRVKTDARDAERLARQLAAGSLTFVRIPCPAEESLRDLVRAREDIRADLMRARHRLSKFLLRYGRRYGDGHGRNWSKLHMHWLAQQGFDDAATEVAFTDYVGAVRNLTERRDRREMRLEELLPGSPFAATSARLRCFRGIDTLSAAGLCAEIGPFERFDHPAKLSSYLGVVPGEWTTDTKRRQGSITKAGPGHARRLLVEAAWHYRRAPSVGLTLERRQREAPAAAIEVAWRCQQRLHDRWRRLRIERGKPAGLVAIACSRELANFCWEAAVVDA